MIRLKKRIIRWGNSAGIYVPKEHIGKWANVQILEEPRLSEQYVYGTAISMECYGYALLKPESFAPDMRSISDMKSCNTFNYCGEEIKIMLPEDIILELITKNPDFKLLKGIPVMLFKYEKRTDFSYMIAKALEAGKGEFLGYILEIILKIFYGHNVRKELQTELKAAVKKIKIKANIEPGSKIKFLSSELERIYYSTKSPERVESTKRDHLMKKWNIAYMPKEKEFEETFTLYSVD